MEGVLTLHACIISSWDNLSCVSSITVANFFIAFLTVRPISISVSTCIGIVLWTGRRQYVINCMSHMHIWTYKKKTELKHTIHYYLWSMLHQKDTIFFKTSIVWKKYRFFGGVFNSHDLNILKIMVSTKKKKTNFKYTTFHENKKSLYIENNQTWGGWNLWSI